MVGLRPDKTPPWALGIVRRLSRLSESESSVGIEVLSGKPQDIFLYNQQTSAYTVNGMDAHNGRAAMAGLLLDDPNAPSIVSDPAHYLRNGILEYRLLHEVKTIQMEDTIDNGEGWIRVRVTRLD